MQRIGGVPQHDGACARAAPFAVQNPVPHTSGVAGDAIPTHDAGYQLESRRACFRAKENVVVGDIRRPVASQTGAGVAYPEEAREGRAGARALRRCGRLGLTF